MTAWEDWQSQIPEGKEGNGVSQVLMAAALGWLTIAGNDEELVVLAHLVDDDIGIGRDNLLLGGELGALLELEVSDGSREGQVSVDAAKVDKATSSRDSRLFT